MARQVKVDLRGAPPVSGGLRDHVPPGRYRLKVVNMEDSTSNSGKRMFKASYKVSEGEFANSNLGDNFVLVDNNGGPSKIGLGRLHHFFLCLDLKVKEAVVNLDLDNLNGLEFEAEVQDEKFTDNSGNERISSAIRGYFAVRSNNGASEPAVVAPAATAVAEPAITTSAEPAVEEPAALPEEPGPMPEPAAPAQPAVAAEPTPVETETVAEEIDDLFK